MKTKQKASHRCRDTAAPCRNGGFHSYRSQKISRPVISIMHCLNMKIQSMTSSSGMCAFRGCSALSSPAECSPRRYYDAGSHEKSSRRAFGHRVAECRAFNGCKLPVTSFSRQSQDVLHGTCRRIAQWNFSVSLTMHSASNQNMSRILLAGTALGTFFLSLASIIALWPAVPRNLPSGLPGGFGQVAGLNTGPVTVIGGTFSAAALFLGRISYLDLGDRNSCRTRTFSGKCKACHHTLPGSICAVCVACNGNIAFIGLFVPHILRRLIGNDYRKLMPLSAFCHGSGTLVTADIAARTISSPTPDFR